MKPIKTYIQLIILLLSGSLVGCFSMTDIELPDQEARMVINGLLDPDSLISVYVSQTLPTTTKFDLEPITHAELEVYENGELLTTLSHRGQGFYQSEVHKPKPGAVYELKGRAKGFPAIQAKDTVPQAIQLSLIKEAGIGESNIQEAMYELQDSPGEDYYYIYGLEEAFQYDSTLMVWERQDLYSSYMYLGPLEPFGDYFFHDKTFNGETIQFKAPMSHEEMQGYSWKKKYTIRFGRCSYTFYRYIKTYDDHMHGDHVFSNPAVVYGNVKGGYGIWAAYHLEKI